MIWLGIFIGGAIGMVIGGLLGNSKRADLERLLHFWHKRANSFQRIMERQSNDVDALEDLFKKYHFNRHCLTLFEDIERVFKEADYCWKRLIKWEKEKREKEISAKENS